MRLIVNAQDASRLPGEFRSYAVIVPSRAWSGALPNVISWTLLLCKQLSTGGYSCQIVTNQNWDRLEALRDGQVDESLAQWWFTTGRKLRIAYTVVDGFYRPHAKPADTPRGEPEEGTRCMEILILLFLFYPTFVGKKSLEDTPVVGRVMKSMHCIFVDRLAIKGHQQSTTDAIHKYISAPGKGSPVLLFPEGTTTNGLGLIPFRSGAFCQDVPVLPVAITYPMYRPGETFDPHWTAIKAVPYAVGLMAQPYTTMRIQILHPESRREGESPGGFADRVRKMMAQSLHERLVAGTFPDKVAIEGAIRRGDIPMKVVNEFALRQWKEM
ncbi:Lysophosphatidylcholine acyltransferase 2 [Perkinsus olseni]|nr:Lysophosphatidylcholine acyltransferase 2 [Perkinsus olseni]